MTSLHPATVSPILAGLTQPTRSIQKITTQTLPADRGADKRFQSAAQTTTVAEIYDFAQANEPERQTTLHERLIGEMRRWTLLTSNWDGEGAAAPILQSLKEAISFARLLDDGETLPAPMLNASGRTGLFWKGDGLYADIEFLGDARIAYYIENQGDKHKGVVKFDSKNMPVVFTALIGA